MGMFDTVDIRHQCPRCYAITEDELQTKDGACLLNCIKKGEYVSRLGLIFTEGMFTVYGDCSICHWWIDYHAIVRKGKLTGVVPKGMHSQYHFDHYIEFK